jgi:hypothetical protein
VDPDLDEILLRDASTGTQVKAKVRSLYGSGIAAWGRFDGSIDAERILNTWNLSTDEIITTVPVTRFVAGDPVWFERSNADVSQYVAYYLRPVDSTHFQLYRTKAGAIAQDQAQRVDLTLNLPSTGDFARPLMAWKSNPIIGGANFSAVIRSIEWSDRGFYRIFFTTPMASANYGILATAGRPSSGGRDGFITLIDMRPADTDDEIETSQVPAPGSFGIQTKDGAETEDSPIVCFTVLQ